MTSPSELQILHSCNHVICVAKPAGLPTVPDSSGDESLFDRVKGWIAREFDKPGAVFLGVVHRLDRPVSGVLAFARTSKAASRLTRAFHDRTTVKTYIAITSKPLEKREGTVEHWLLKKGSKNVVRVVAEGTEGARLAKTTYRRLETRNGMSLVMLMPESGRSHQLRVAMASIGAPLVGDVKYKAPTPLADRSLALHAAALVVPHPTQAEPIAVKASPNFDPALPWSQFRAAIESVIQVAGRSD